MTHLRSHRLVQTRYVRNAFDGEGARLYGGRWNSLGTPMVYTAQSLALAAMELLVHLNSRRALEQRYQFLVAEFPEKLCRQVQEFYRNPRDWAADPARLSSMRLGDRWVREGKSAVLAVPSAVIRDEWNYLINPKHPDFIEIEVDKTKPFQFDARLEG